MLRKFTALCAALFAAAFALVGCDARMSDLKPGVSTAADVSAVMGKHTFEWKEPDGGVTWEFPRGPAGVVTYLITIGQDGKLREIRQVLTDANFARLKAGMTGDEVRRVVGRPAETMKFANLGEDVWSWKYEPATGEQWMYHVHFNLSDGKLKRTSRTQVNTPP